MRIAMSHAAGIGGDPAVEKEWLANIERVVRGGTMVVANAARGNLKAVGIGEYGAPGKIPGLNTRDYAEGAAEPPPATAWTLPAGGGARGWAPTFRNAPPEPPGHPAPRPA